LTLKENPELTAEQVWVSVDQVLAEIGPIYSHLTEANRGKNVNYGH